LEKSASFSIANFDQRGPREQVNQGTKISRRRCDARPLIKHFEAFRATETRGCREPHDEYGHHHRSQGLGQVNAARAILAGVPVPYIE
jgi:hypothetical protein